MKKLTLIAMAVVAFAGTALKAQITVTSSNMPIVGDKFIWVYDSSGTITSPGGSGGSQTWNFSTMNVKSPDTINVVTPGSTPYASKFPGAGMAFKLSQGKSEYEFVNTTVSAFDYLGVTLYNATYGQIYYHMNPVWDFYALPATYGTTWSGTYISTMKTAYASGPYDSIGEIEYATYSDDIDAWGNITTPTGTYNSLRDKHLEKDVDSTLLHIASPPSWVTVLTTTSHYNFYSWYSNSADYFIAEVLMDSNDVAVTGVQWLKNSPAGINELTNSNGKTWVYPDPASDAVNIQMSTGINGTIKIVDMTGQEMANMPYNGKIQINTVHYPSGVYFFIITDSGGNIVDREKFSVIR